MMDSHDTNQPLNPGELEEEKKTVEVSETITETPTEEMLKNNPKQLLGWQQKRKYLCG